MILYPTYFSPIVQFVALSQSNEVLFEVEDNYQKQTYRNRCYIFGPQGKQLLNIPVQHDNSRKTKDIKIDTSFNWYKQHCKSIQFAYRSSPFFEFYEEEIINIFDKIPLFLIDFNFKCLDKILDLLDLKIPYSLTNQYVKNYTNIIDARSLVEAKTNHFFKLDKYFQVFSNNFGFIGNLSILDLLFMEGPNAINYLENQSVTFN